MTGKSEYIESWEKLAAPTITNSVSSLVSWSQWMRSCMSVTIVNREGGCIGRMEKKDFEGKGLGKRLRELIEKSFREERYKGILI